MRLAIIADTEVKNVIEGELSLFPNAIDVTGTSVSKNWQYDRETGEFSPPIQPVPVPRPPAINVLSTDTWSIPADGTTEATVTYTSNDTVYFAVNGDIHAVEPVESVSTLSVSADAPGMIEIKVKDKQLIVAAVEVTA